MVYGDSLSAFGNAQTVEIPPDLIASPYGGIANTNDATAKVPLGTRYRYKGNLYRYVQWRKQTNSNDPSAGCVVFWHTSYTDPATGKFAVTGDYTYTLGQINTVAGVLLCAPTNLYYTWIQVGGWAIALNTSGAVAGDVAIGQANDDQEFAHIDDDTKLTDVPYAVVMGARNLLGNTANYVLLLPSALGSF